MKIKGLLIAGAALAVLTSVAIAAEPPWSGDRATRIGAQGRGVSYLWNFVPADLLPDKHPYGGNLAEAWIYTRLFTDSGKQYIFMRTIADQRSNGVTLTTDGKPDPRITRTAVDASRTVDPAAGLVFAGQGFNVKLSPTAVNWTEDGGALSIHGEGSPLAKVGTSALIPYEKDGAAGVDMYTGQYQPVTGTVYGEAVKGMFVIDHFVGQGVKFGGSQLLANHVVWFKFANVFSDGSVEMGEFYRQDGDKRSGVITDGTRAIVHTQNPRVKFVFNPKGDLVKETWTIDKDNWEFTPDKFAATPLGKSGLMQIYGGFRRIGDKRKIVNQFAIAEWNRSRLNPDEQ